MATTKTTYRVQGLPANASHNDIKAIISKALGENELKLDPTIHSLGSDPYKLSNTNRKVATVTFNYTPANLKTRDKLTAKVIWGGTKHYISVDSSFGGFTPLNDTGGELGAVME